MFGEGGSVLGSEKRKFIFESEFVHNTLCGAVTHTVICTVRYVHEMNKCVKNDWNWFTEGDPKCEICTFLYYALPFFMDTRRPHRPTDLHAKCLKRRVDGYESALCRWHDYINKPRCSKSSKISNFGVSYGIFQ